MPASPSMYVIALRQDAVFRNAGSYDISPPSPSAALIWRRSVARIVPSTIGNSYSWPVRLSTTFSVSLGIGPNASASGGVHAFDPLAPLLEPVRGDVDR